MTLPDKLGESVIESASTVFRNNKEWADKAIAQLPDDKLRVVLDASTNSVAVIMKHVAGNLLSRWTDFLTTDGEKPWRNRDGEFLDSFHNRSEILDFWGKGWSCLFASLSQLDSDDLTKTVTIRGESHSVPLSPKGTNLTTELSNHCKSRLFFCHQPSPSPYSLPENQGCAAPWPWRQVADFRSASSLLSLSTCRIGSDKLASLFTLRT